MTSAMPYAGPGLVNGAGSEMATGSSNLAHNAASSSDGQGAKAANHHSGSAPLQSCSYCRKRKIKCDKSWPSCSQCLRASTPCTYPASQRRGRPRTSTSVGQNPMLTREEQLLRRIRRLETVIESLKGGDADVDTTYDPTDPLREQLGRLVVGKPYLNDGFWDSNELKDILDDSEESDVSDFEDIAPDQAFILGEVGLQMDDLHSLHPPINQIPIYWKIYHENCEVILRLLHTPSMVAIVKEAVLSKLQSLSRADELLLFCVYFTAITSLTEDKVVSQFGVSKDFLLSRYQLAIKSGLIQAKFMHTQELKVLQGFVLYLLSLKHSDDPKGAIVWTMVGLALRICQGMGLDRDGKLFKLPPFETEMRRRLWYQLLLLDLRSAEGRGCLSTRLAYDTQLPTLCNDSALQPDMTEYPKPVVGQCDMTISLMRLEICTMGRRLQATNFDSVPLSVPAKKKAVADFFTDINEKYLQYCENASPVHQYSMKTGRLILARFNLIVHKGDTKSVPQEEQDWLFDIAMDVMEYANELRHSTAGKRWSWLLKTQIQWIAVAWVLAELCTRQPSAQTDRAWIIVEASREEWTAPADSAGTVIYQNVRKLLNKAIKIRRAQNGEQPSQDQSPMSVTSGSTPVFVDTTEDQFAYQVPPLQHNAAMPMPMPMPMAMPMQQPPPLMPNFEWVGATDAENIGASMGMMPLPYQAYGGNVPWPPQQGFSPITENDQATYYDASVSPSGYVANGLNTYNVQEPTQWGYDATLGAYGKPADGQRHVRG